MTKYTNEQALKDYYDELADNQNYELDYDEDEGRNLAIDFETGETYDEPDYDYFEEGQALSKFYAEHIAGKEYIDGLDGYEVYKFAHEMWGVIGDANKYTYLYDFARSDEFLTAASEKFGFSKSDIAYTMDLSEAWGTYSDWHKDIYGVRPH